MLYPLEAKRKLSGVLLVERGPQNHFWTAVAKVPHNLSLNGAVPLRLGAIYGQTSGPF